MTSPTPTALTAQAVEAQGVEVTRLTLRRIVDAAWNAATESETVPDTAWADRIINEVLASPPRGGDGAGIEPAPGTVFRIYNAQHAPGEVGTCGECGLDVCNGDKFGCCRGAECPLAEASSPVSPAAEARNALPAAPPSEGGRT